MTADFDIADFGAVADGVTMNTQALQAAIDACHAAGGGRVRCGSGQYLTGSIELKSFVELHLSAGCTLVGSPNPDDYQRLVSEGFRDELSNEKTADYLVGARHARQIGITGPGEINASGPTFYDASAGFTASGKFPSKPSRRPRLLMMHRCTDVRIEDATFADSPCWTFWLMQCKRVGIHRIRICGDRRMRNNDGIDIDSCRDVIVSDCHIQSEDDSIVVRAIQKLYDTPAVCENIVVTNCTLESTCQCIRVSCPGDHITRDCVFSNLTLQSRGTGINFDFPHRYLKSGAGRGSADVGNMIFSNILVRCRRHPIRIAIEPGMRLERVAGLTFSDMRFEGGWSCLVQGSEETPIEDVTFRNIVVESREQEPVVCRHCRRIKFDHVELTHSAG